MPAQFNFGSFSKSQLVASSVGCDTNTGPSMNHAVAPSAHESQLNRGPTGQPVNDVDPRMASIYRIAPFDEHHNELVRTSRWERDLDDRFTHIFEEPILSEYPIDAMVARALQIIGNPTQAKIRGLALALCAHWMRLQFRCKNAKVCGPEIVTLISTMVNYLGRTLVSAQRDFLNELNHLCTEKLKSTWRWVRSRWILTTVNSHLHSMSTSYLTEYRPYIAKTCLCE